MGDSPDAPACPQPCGEPSHFLRHLREAIARVRAFPGEPDPRAQVTISPDLRDRIADVDAARERAYADGPIAAATAQLSQLAGWRVAVDPACPDGVVLIVPPRASDDPGSP